LQNNNILVAEESGFRNGMPIDIAVLKVTESVSKSINQKMHGGGIFKEQG
jgi:hypothetical protein